MSFGITWPGQPSLSQTLCESNIKMLASHSCILTLVQPSYWMLSYISQHLKYVYSLAWKFLCLVTYPQDIFTHVHIYKISASLTL